MKNILVPTDFSDCAGYALEFAYAIADIYDSNIIVFNNIQSDTFWPTFGSDNQDFKAKQLQKKSIEDSLHNLISKAPIDENRIKSLHMEGDFIQNINNIVEKNKIDFIVMGSHGASGKKEIFLGSNTQKVVRSVDCSIFVVKNSVANYKIDKVVFASNFHLTDIEPLEYMLDFIRPYLPEIHLVEINTPSIFNVPNYIEKQVMNDFKKLCEGFVCHTHLVKDISVDSGVRRITKEIGADLIVVSNNQNKPIKHFLRGSNVEFLVNHSEVPVLSINTRTVSKNNN